MVVNVIIMEMLIKTDKLVLIIKLKMIARTLFGRLAPKKFDRQLHYYEEFRLGYNFFVEFGYCRSNNEELSIVLVKPSHGQFYYKETLRQVDGLIFSHDIMSIGLYHKYPIDFDSLIKYVIRPL